MSNGNDKKDKKLRAMAFADGSLVVHSETDGFSIEVHDSELGEAKPIDLDITELHKLRGRDLKEVKVHKGKIKDRSAKDDKQDVSDTVREV